MAQVERQTRNRRCADARRYHSDPRACSSVDRASASGAEGRRFESCRARQCNLFGWHQRESVGVRRRSEPDEHDLPPCDGDPVVDGVEQVGLLSRNLSGPSTLLTTPGATSRPARARSHRRSCARGSPWQSGGRATARGRPRPRGGRRHVPARARGSGGRSARGRLPLGAARSQARDDRSDGGVVERDPLELCQEHASEERDDELGPAHPATREELTARTYPGEPGVDSGSDQRAVMALGCGPRTAVPSWPIGPSRRPWRRSAAAGRLASRAAFAATEGLEEASYCGRGDRMTTAVSRERRAA